jgi:hypothetical protein
LKLIDWPSARALKVKTAIVIPYAVQRTVSLPPQCATVDAPFGTVPRERRYFMNVMC